jgi:hypothetical protein
LFDAAVYGARVDDEFIFDVEDGDFGLFDCVGTTAEDIGEDASDAFCLDCGWGNHDNVLLE